jgi:hypothetical protein
MGLIHIDLFTTLDGVAQAPGGPDEDTDSNFAFGGWQAPLIDEVVGEQVRHRRTEFLRCSAGGPTTSSYYWPHQQARSATCSTGFPSACCAAAAKLWTARRCSADVVRAVRRIRDRHSNVHVSGSLDFVQTLLTERLFDRLTLWMYPIVIGSGKKIFADGTVPSNLTLVEPAGTSSKGAVTLRYALADGTPSTGDMTRDYRDGGDGRWPALLQELARGVVGEDLAAGLARRAVRNGVAAVHITDRVAADRTRFTDRP